MEAKRADKIVCPTFQIGGEFGFSGERVSMTKCSFEESKREQHSFLAHLEKRVLLLLASWMPTRINSDHLTALGFLAMLMAGLSYYWSRSNSMFLHWVNFFILVNWFGDSLDGTLARFRNKTRPRYGFYVDHILDTFSTLFLIGGMALSGRMSQQVAAALLVVYFMLCINVYLATYTMGTFKISFGKLSPTELRILLAAGNLFVLYHPRVEIMGEKFWLFDVGGAVAIVIIALILLTSTIRNVRVLYREEKV